MSYPGFFAELKRRHVYKMAVAYAVVAWLIIQVATQVFPFFDVPNWAVRLVVLLLILGFPVALILSWAFELTPEGIKRSEDVSPNEQRGKWAGRRSAALIIVVALAAGGLFLLQRVGLLVPKTAHGNEPRPAAAAPGVINSKSIAVLPFVNMSSDRENEYFVDGLTEEILNRLAQVSALKVPGRTSSFAFKGKNTDLREIGTALGVAHVLEGSVRKSGDRLRITAELIRTADGYHLWSNSFDRKLDDVFTVQEEIARSIADALSAPLGLIDARGTHRQTKDMQAYDNFLQARALLANRTGKGLHSAIELLTAAVTRDPDFADGWAALAQARALSLYYVSEGPEPLKQAEEAARKALALDDSIPVAHSALADVLRDRYEWIEAEKEYERALKLSPGEAETHNQYAQMLLKLGHLDRALTHALLACELEPLGWVPPSVVSLIHLSGNDPAQGRVFLERSEKISGHIRGFHSRLEFLFALSEGDAAAARRALALARAPDAWSSNPPGERLLDAMDEALARWNKSTGSTVDLGKALREIQSAGEVDRGLPCSATALFVGQKQAALDALPVEARTPGLDLAGFIWTPVYQSVRNEPAFREILKAMKMPEVPACRRMESILPAER